MATLNHYHCVTTKHSVILALSRYVMVSQTFPPLVTTKTQHNACLYKVKNKGTQLAITSLVTNKMQYNTGIHKVSNISTQTHNLLNLLNHLFNKGLKSLKSFASNL